MNKAALSIASVLLLHTLLIGCSDPAPPESASPQQPAVNEPAQAPGTPPESQAAHSDESESEDGSSSSTVGGGSPSHAGEPAVDDGPEAAGTSSTVTAEVYRPQSGNAAAGSTSGDRKAVSWYYMKQKKGVVPNFPAETKRFTPEQKVVWVGTGKKVYLTFDNGGPMGDIDKMLQVLKDNDVRASYFIAGYNMKAHPDFVRRLVEDGHFVGNHSMSHKDFTEMTDDQVRKEIDDFAKLYEEITGETISPVFRFPYGSYSFHLLDLVSSMGYTSVFWSTAMRDWEPRQNGWKDPYNDIMNNLHDGNIILLHQASQENIDALEELIKAIRKEGYEFGTVDELIPRT